MTDDSGHFEDAVGHFSDTADHYARKHYDDPVRSFMTVRQRRVLEFIDRLSLSDGAKVLDAGCGPGYLLERLARRGFRVSGLDAAEGMLANARVRLETTESRFPVDLKRGDIEELPYEAESFDLVLSTGVIEYLSDDAPVLKEVNRVLRPGGYLVLPVTNRWSRTLWLDPGVECLKCRACFRKPFNAMMAHLGQRPLLPRHFQVRQHSPRQFRAALRSAGFDLVDEIYFYSTSGSGLDPSTSSYRSSVPRWATVWRDSGAQFSELLVRDILRSR